MARNTLVAQFANQWLETQELNLSEFQAEFNNIYAELSKSALDQELAAHVGNTTNPHAVTAAQLGASNILNELKKVDGSASGLDTDLIRGEEPSVYARKTTTDSHATKIATLEAVSHKRPLIASVDGSGVTLSAVGGGTLTLTRSAGEAVGYYRLTHNLGTTAYNVQFAFRLTVLIENGNPIQYRTGLISLMDKTANYIEIRAGDVNNPKDFSFEVLITPV